MPERHSSERVDSLFNQLQAIELQLVDNQQAFLHALDDKYSASGLGALQDEAQALTRAAATIVQEIEEHVAGSSAREVFRRRA
jgi:hypothetical protein